MLNQTKEIPTDRELTVEEKLRLAQADISDLLELCNKGEFGWTDFHFAKFRNIEDRNLQNEPIPPRPFCREYDKEIKELESKLTNMKKDWDSIIHGIRHAKSKDEKIKEAKETLEWLRLQISGPEFNNNMTNKIDEALATINKVPEEKVETK